MGYPMRRTFLAYKVPSNNEGYDLICIHPDPRHCPKKGELTQVRVQVKSRYATDCDRGFPVKEQSLSAFDFLVVAFLNIGNFFQGKDGSAGYAGAGVLHIPQQLHSQASCEDLHLAEGAAAPPGIRSTGSRTRPGSS